VGDRHPKISDNVLIGACATVLGNITVGRGAQIAAGSLVLKPVPAHTMVAGSPAKEVGKVAGECDLGWQRATWEEASGCLVWANSFVRIVHPSQSGS
jgi:serine acetyltransferase